MNHKTNVLRFRISPVIDLAKEAFPWLSVKKLTIGQVKCVGISVSFSGELAYEIHVPNAQLLMVHDLLMQAGEEFGIGYFGLRAVESMRLEKGYLHWKADIITEYNPIETGLDRFVQMEKDFIGKEALQNMVDKGPRRILRTLELDSDQAPSHPGDSILMGDMVVGTITSAAWGYRIGKNIAYAFVDPETSENLSVLTATGVIDARITDRCLYDPDNLHAKS